MIHLSTSQLLSLWSDLDDAYHGKNGYGGDVAEIYMYRLMQRCPTVEAAARDTELYKEASAEQIGAACASLYNLLRFFAEAREARVIVNGRRLGPWVRGAGFDHRVHVSVRQRRRRP